MDSKYAKDSKVEVETFTPPNEKSRKIFKRSLRVVLLVVFMAWLTVWLLLPTKTYYDKWRPHIERMANTTYFASEGITLLLFSYPMMFIAILSCIYLHLGKTYSTESGGATNRLAFLRLPVSVRAPLGIMTGMELLFSIMFIILLVWSSFLQFREHTEGEVVVMTKFNRLRSFSQVLGHVGTITWAFLFFPVTRGSSILRMVGLTSESSIKYHIWLGHLSMILFIGHSIGFVIYWALTDQLSLMLEWSHTWVSNIAGEIAFVFAVLMWVTSIQGVRRKFFEIFFYTHHLYTLYLFFFVLHVGIAHFCTILPGIFLFLIDRYLRFLQSWRRVQLISVRILPSEAVELNFSKDPGLIYSPTSIVFVNIPILSKLQWHPFTVTSNSNLDPEKLSVIIQCEGSWSTKLYETLSSPYSDDHLDVSVEGPYGPSSLPFLRYDSLVMVSGGSGITSIISVVREIIHRRKTNNCSIRKIHLICSFRKYIDLSMLDLLLPDSVVHSDIDSIEFKIEAFITRETVLPIEDIRTICFKPNPANVPITHILGPNNWLWLGAIVSSSFFMFLLLLGLLTQYYIFPTYKNFKDQYTLHETIPYFSGRALWGMVFICLSVVLASSVAFLWNKKQYMRNLQLERMDSQSPSTSRSSSFHKGDPEMQHVPPQFLNKATEVYFGERPDFKKILLSYKGSNVGVMVCGPSRMRHEIAKICSSGLVDNLHFEGISFSW